MYNLKDEGLLKMYMQGLDRLFGDRLGVMA